MDFNSKVNSKEGNYNMFRYLLNEVEKINKDRNDPKIYRALLTQAGTADPTVEILENNTGIDITWTRLGLGTYVTESLPGDLTKGAVSLPIKAADTDTIIRTQATYDEKGPTTIFRVYTYGGNGATISDSRLDRNYIEILIFD